MRNLQMMRQFHLKFPNANALRSELSWTHYRSLMRVEDEVARRFYLEEAVKCSWSSRQLDRQINSFYYQRILASKDKDSVAVEIDTLEPQVMPCPAEDNNTKRENWMESDEGRKRVNEEVINIITCVENGLIPDFEI